MALTCATFYHIWKERNDKKFRGKAKSSAQLVFAIVNKLFIFLSMKVPEAPDSTKFWIICDNLKIHPVQKRSEPKVYSWFRLKKIRPC